MNRLPTFYPLTAIIQIKISQSHQIKPLFMCSGFLANSVDPDQPASEEALGPPGVLGILGEWLFIFRELGSTGNYFRGAKEQADNFGGFLDISAPNKLGP